MYKYSYSHNTDTIYMSHNTVLAMTSGKYLK